MKALSQSISFAIPMRGFAFRISMPTGNIFNGKLGIIK